MIRLALAGGRPPESFDGVYPRLVMVEGPEPRQWWPIVKDETSIGAGHACDVALAIDGLPARCAVLRRGQDGWWLTIQAGAGFRVVRTARRRVRLVGGDKIVMGHALLAFQTNARDAALSAEFAAHFERLRRISESRRARTIAVIEVMCTDAPDDGLAEREATFAVRRLLAEVTGEIVYRMPEGLTWHTEATAEDARELLTALAEFLADTPLLYERGFLRAHLSFSIG